MTRAVTMLMLFVLTFAVQAAEEKKKVYTRNVAVVLYENVQPLDWTGPYEVYNDAGSFGAANGQRAFNVYTVSKTLEPVNGQGLMIKPTYSIANAPKPDIVIFPGGPSNNITDDPEFFAWAKKVAIEAEIAQSVCTGAFVLGKAGLLDGLTVTTFFGAIDNLQKSYPKAKVSDGRRYIDNGQVVTTAGISAGIDGSLHVVARLLGRRVADQVSRYMEYHWTPEPYLARAYQYLNPSTDDRGRLVQNASMRREEKNLGEAVKLYRQALEGQGGDRATLFALGDALHENKEYVAAAEAFVTAAKSAEGHYLHHALFNAACSFTMAGRLDDGLDYLAKAYAAGFSDRDAVKNEPDLAALRNHPRLATAIAASR
jgi:transcriptional regulator GlxA family with amidase domain